VKTFSIRLGSRRNHRPVHQKIRSITTVSPTIDTSRIGHITGPPRWNLSINQLLPSRPPLGCASAAGSGFAAAGLDAAAAAAAGDSPGAPGLIAAGAPGLVAAAAPGCPGAAGCCAAGCPGAAACPGGTLVAGACCAAGLVPAAGGAFAGGGDCASEVSASASEHREIVSNVFIVEAQVWCDRFVFGTGFLLSQTTC